MSQFQTWDLQIMKQQNKIYTKSTRQGTNLSHQGKKEKSSTQKWFLMGYVSSLRLVPFDFGGFWASKNAAPHVRIHRPKIFGPP